MSTNKDHTPEEGLIGGREKREITIAPYSYEWPEIFENHQRIIKAALSDNALAVEHIGSTSVPGLSAKPIIDILLVVKDSGNEWSYIPNLEKEGYVLRVREPDFEEHRMLRSPEKDIHLHVFSEKSPEVTRHILFRDQLRKSPTDRKRYEETKIHLASKNWADMNAYAEAKTDIIEKIISEGLNEHLTRR